MDIIANNLHLFLSSKPNSSINVKDLDEFYDKNPIDKVIIKDMKLSKFINMYCKDKIIMEFLNDGEVILNSI